MTLCPHRTPPSATGVVAPSPPFPQEIHDEIMAYIEQETLTLRSCAIVCRAWLPRARYYLFRHVILDPSTRTQQFVQLLQGCPEIQSLVQDLELRGRAPTSMKWWEGPLGSSNIVGYGWPILGAGNLANPRPPMRREADALEILSWLRDTFASSSPSPRTGSDAGAEHAGSTPAFDRDSPRAPARVFLPKVRTLRLSEFILNTDAIAFMAAAFPAVGTLSVNGCRTMSFADFVALLQAFPRMRTLRLLSAEWLLGRPGSPAPVPTQGAAPGPASGVLPLPHLRVLELSRDIYTEPLLEWLVRAGAHANLRALKCSIATHQGATAMRAFLVASGPFLESLSITLSESRDPTAILETAHLDLAPCTALQRLQIRCSPPRSAGPMQRSLSWVLILLSKVRSPRLDVVRISIKADELLSLNLEGLDVVLGHNLLDRLASLTFEVDHSLRGGGKRSKQGIEDVLKTRMPIANAQQVVCVEYGDS